MPKKILSSLKYIVIFSLTGYLLWGSFNAIDQEVLEPGQSRFSFILKVWNRGDKFFFFLSALFTVLSHLLRAERWKLLLNPLGYTPSLWNCFTAVMNGYFINLAIPRGGEVSRPVTLNKLDKIPVGTSIGTVVMERIIDLIFLVLCIGTVFLFQFDLLVEFFQSLPMGQTEGQGFTIPPIVIYGIIGLVAVSITGLVLYKVKPELFVKLKDKAIDLTNGLKSGLMSIFKLDKWFLFIVYSILIWVCYFLMLWMILLAFNETETLGFIDALSIFVVGGIALAMPTPGGAGSYHTMVPLAMVHLCGLDSLSKGVAFATIFHGWQTIIVILLGMIGMIVINNKTKANAVKG